MPTTTTPTYLRRYTDLPALLHMLAAKQLTLLDPKTWDDQNDSFFMSQYKERKKLKTVLALCFSQTAKTYHHWRSFLAAPPARASYLIARPSSIRCERWRASRPSLLVSREPIAWIDRQPKLLSAVAVSLPRLGVQPATSKTPRRATNSGRSVLDACSPSERRWRLKFLVSVDSRARTVAGGPRAER